MVMFEVPEDSAGKVVVAQHQRGAGSESCVHAPGEGIDVAHGQNDEQTVVAPEALMASIAGGHRVAPGTASRSKWRFPGAGRDPGCRRKRARAGAGELSMDYTCAMVWR